MQVEPRVPSELDGYRPLEFISSGGMGEVWLANNLRLGKPCVLKILRPRLARLPKHRRRFFREAEIGVSLEHGRIVSVLDFGEAHGYLYLVLKFIDGIDLVGFYRALAEGRERLPLVAIGYIMGEVFEALHHAHNRLKAGKPSAVIHRDVTPSNVLVSSDGEVFLTDFGIAHYETEVPEEASGTLQYMAPEQARGGACLASDIYGAAGVLHFMLTGDPPREVDDVEALESLLDAPPVPLERGDVPEPLERVRTMGLEPDPDRRLRSANDALVLIDSWEGYRKSTRLLARFYRRYIGPPRSGLTGLVKAAEADRTKSAAVAQRPPPEESTRMTVKVARKTERGQDTNAGEHTDSSGGVPVRQAVREDDADSDDWNHAWWRDDDDDGDDDESIEEHTTQRYLPPADAVEPDAPRVLRRPHRRPLDPILDREPHTPEVG